MNCPQASCSNFLFPAPSGDLIAHLATDPVFSLKQAKDQGVVRECVYSLLLLREWECVYSLLLLCWRSMYCVITFAAREETLQRKNLQRKETSPGTIQTIKSNVVQEEVNEALYDCKFSR